MEKAVLCKQRVQEYGITYHVELRKRKNFKDKIIYTMYKVYDEDCPPCEEILGFTSYDNFSDAMEAFQRVTGVHFTDEYIELIKYKNSKIEV